MADFGCGVGDMADPPSQDGVTGGFDLVWSKSATETLGFMAIWCFNQLNSNYVLSGRI